MTNRPILFVDIDGVLNPFGPECPAGYEDHALFPNDELPIRVNQLHAVWLGELADVFDLVWATGWNAEDRTVLTSVLPLPPFAGFANMPPIPFNPARKVDGINEFAGDRPAAWIDDVITPEAIDWADTRDAATLLLSIIPEQGLQRSHVDQLLSWANTLP